MNYKKIYDAIIIKANSENRIKLRKNQQGYIYYEKHHIIPRCIGGTDDENNLVLLTAREHYICHKLLTYIYKHRGINLAFFRLSYDNRKRKVSSKDYAYAKELMHITSHTEETKKRISLSLLGKPISLETRKKHSATNLLRGINKGEKNPMHGISLFELWKQKFGEKIANENYIKYSQKLSKSLCGRKFSEEHKQNLRKPKSEEAKQHMRKPNNHCWVCNKSENISLQINKNEVDEFLKTNTNYSKGRIISEEQKNKMKLSMKGRIPWNKGLKLNTN